MLYYKSFTIILVLLHSRFLKNSKNNSEIAVIEKTIDQLNVYLHFKKYNTFLGLGQEKNLRSFVVLN